MSPGLKSHGLSCLHGSSSVVLKVDCDLGLKDQEINEAEEVGIMIDEYAEVDAGGPDASSPMLELPLSKSVSLSSR